MPKPFKGTIKLDVRDSVPDWDPYIPPRAPEGAPNVLIVLYDDTGLAAWEPFGGRIEMPTLKRLADNGLRYSQWHTTALCSPTRSCFLTGRNHHQNGMACITEGSIGFPGAQRAHPAGVRHDGRGDAAGRLEHLLARQEPQRAGRGPPRGRDEGELAAAPGLRPLLRLPRRRDEPVVSRPQVDNHHIDQPYQPEEGYHLSKDLADQAIQMIRDVKADRAVAAVVHVVLPRRQPRPAPRAPQEWTDKYKGKFDDGYEAYREWALPRMIEQGHPPRGHRADADEPDAGRHLLAARRRAPLGLALRRREAAVRADGRGLRRLLRVHRPPGRADRRLPRGDRAARQHDHLLLRRQRRLRRGQPERLGQREQVLQRLARRDGGEPRATSTTSAARTPTTTTRPAGRWPSRRRSGCSSATATRAASATRWSIHWPKGIEAQGRGAPPVPPRDRHRPDDPRLLRARVPRDAERPRAGAAARALDALLVRRRRRADDEGAPVLRDARHARHLGGRLEGRRRARADLRASATSTRTSGSSSTPTRTAPRRTTSPPSTPRS